MEWIEDEGSRGWVDKGNGKEMQEYSGIQEDDR